MDSGTALGLLLMKPLAMMDSKKLRKAIPE